MLPLEFFLLDGMGTVKFVDDSMGTRSHGEIYIGYADESTSEANRLDPACPPYKHTVEMRTHILFSYPQRIVDGPELPAIIDALKKATRLWIRQLNTGSGEVWIRQINLRVPSCLGPVYEDYGYPFSTPIIRNPELNGL